MKILLVGDIPDNLTMLSRILEPEGYVIEIAADAIKTIKASEDFEPDLFLFDTMMSEFDVYETCRQLKQQGQEKPVPVIFVLQKNEIDKLSEVIKAGGDDYIQKPYCPEEIVLRIKNHLMLRQVQLDLQDVIKQKRLFTSALNHDLRSPLAMIQNGTELLIRMHKENSDKSNDKKMEKFLGLILNTSQEMQVMVNNLLDKTVKTKQKKAVG
jgi:DNA-binding response OmpR family regulator